MIQDLKQLLSTYQDASVLRPIGHWIEITTPHLDRHNDYILLYAGHCGEGLVLEDNGHTINDLKNNGFGLRNSAQQNSLRKILNDFNVQMVEQTLLVHATTEVGNLASRQRDLVQAMLAAGGLSSPIQATDHSGPDVSDTYIETANGHFMDLIDPQAMQVSLWDIAASLANITRFTGHCPETVAEHSLLVDWIGCQTLTGTEPCARMRLHWLLHDAHEAYTGDITTPMKRAIGAERIKEIQDRLDRVIYEALHLVLPSAAEHVHIHRADRLALRVAAADLLPSRGRWAGDPDSPEIAEAKRERRNIRREGRAMQRWLDAVYALANVAREDKDKGTLR